MRASVIWVKGWSKDESLTDFADLARSALGLATVEERESSNYCEGHYVVGRRDGAAIKIYYLDTVGLEEYRFIIDVESERSTHVETWARLLSGRGRFCFIPTGPWYLTSWDGQGTSYVP
jgi:hypothetical protein